MSRVVPLSIAFIARLARAIIDVFPQMSVSVLFFYFIPMLP
ncbi:MAG: hypothetical protein NVS4B7_11330 [Ktedonobacteraceae bacterium]